MQAAAARKQAGSFAGEQRALGIVDRLAASEAVDGMPEATRRAPSMQHAALCARAKIHATRFVAPVVRSLVSCAATTESY